MLRAALMVTALLALSTTARADCMTPDQWLGRISDGLAPAAVLVDHSDLSDDLRQVAAVEFNRAPPAREPIMPDRAVVTIAKSVATGFPLPFVLIGFFSHGCAVGTFKVPLMGEGAGGTGG